MATGSPRRSAPLARASSLTALVLLTGSTLTACSDGGGTGEDGGGSSTDAGPVVLQTWGDTKYAEVQAAAYNKAFPDEQVDIEVTSGGEGDGDSVEAFRLALSANKNIPDILQVNYSALPEFVEAGVLADVSEYVEPYLDDVTAAGEELMQVDGNYVAFPYEVKTKLWFYRSDMFDQAGIDPASITTQEQFLAAGEQLRAEFPGSYIWNLGPNPDTYTFQMIASGNGARFSQQDPCEIVVGTDPGVREAFTALKEIRDSGVVIPTVDDWSPEWQSGLADGTIASTLSASWFPVFLQEYAPDLAGKWAVAPWPEIGGAEGGSESAGSVFVIPEASENKEAAARFLAGSLLDPAGVEAFIVERGGDYLPVVESVLSSPLITEDDYFGASLSTAYAASSENFKIFPYDPAALREQDTVSAALTEFIGSSGSDPTPFLKTAQQELAAQIGCPYSG